MLTERNYSGHETINHIQSSIFIDNGRNVDHHKKIDTCANEFKASNIGMRKGFVNFPIE